MIDIKNIKVLVVDDERPVRESIGAFLEDYDITVLEAENGIRGLEILEREKPDVVLLDLKMPVMDGIDTLGRIREIAPDLPVIIISGAGLIEDVVKALRLGAWDYIIKPVSDMNIIIHSIEKALERDRLIQENRAYQEHLEVLVKKRTVELDRANDELFTINSRLRKIVTSAADISFCSSLGNFGKLLIKEFGEHMSASGGSIYVLEDDGLRLIYSLDAGHCPEFIPYPLETESVLNKTINEGKPLLISDISSDSSCRESGWNGYRNGSIITFPLADEKGEVVAVLSLHSKIDPPFIQQDLEIGMILATYSSEALRGIRALEDLRESEEKYRKLFNNARDAIYLWRLNKDNTPGKCIDVNDVAVEFTGYSREELLQMTPMDLDASESLESVPAVMRNLLKAGFATFEMIHLTKEGEKIPVEISSHIFMLKKRRVILSISRDISSRKEAEKKINESLREKELMLKEIHHRVKNNIQIIISILDLQADKIKNSEDLKYFIESENRVRSIALVHEMLYKSESLSSIDFKEYITSLVEQIENSYNYRDKNIMISVNAENQLIGIESAVPCALIINELITNSIKYAFSDVKGGMVNIEFSGDRKSYRLVVTDNGPGFVKEIDLENIESLGLRMVSELVKQLNGTISFDSKNGAVITIMFGENIHPEPDKKIKDEITDPVINGKRLLVVEDERITALHIKSILRSAGYSIVQTVSSGEDALESIRNNEPDIILMDIILEGTMDGIDTVEKIIMEYSIPVIYLTANTDGFIKERAMKTNPFGYIPKPIDKNEMVEMINKGLESH